MTGLNVERHLQQIGLYPLSRTTGIGLFETALCEDDNQLVALWGIRSKLTQTFLNASNLEKESLFGAVPPLLDYYGMPHRGTQPFHSPADPQRIADVPFNAVDFGMTTLAEVHEALRAAGESTALNGLSEQNG